MIQIEIDIEQSGGFSKRKVRSALRVANRAAAETWRDQFLHRHFARSARNRYDYQPRKTQKRKQAIAKNAPGKIKAGGRIDLVHSGLLRSMISKRHHRITAYPTRSMVHIIGPSYLKIRYKAGRPNLTDEILRVIPRERRAFANASDEGFVEELNRKPERKRTKIRAK